MSNSIGARKEHARQPPIPRIWIPWLIQFVMLLVVLFVPFGFDHPSAAGLDFDDFLRLAAMFVGLAVLTVMLAIVGRQWKLLAAEALLVITAVAAVFWVDTH